MARAWLHLNNYNRALSTMASSGKETEHRVQLPEKVRNSRVLILGGTGRVGGSIATALSALCPDLRIVVGGRNKEKGATRVAQLGKNSEFAEVNIDDMESLEATLHGCRSCSSYCGAIPTGREMHCAGSCYKDQGEKQTAYVDVCDDTTYAWRAKSYMSKALAANIPAITTGGIYPGVSNVMAAELVRAARSESKGEPERLRKARQQSSQKAEMIVDCKQQHLLLKFSYYTAGTGGAGPTILATSFLLLGEEVVAYSRGEKIKLKPYTGMLNIDFGKGIGKRDVYLLNLPEVRSAHEVLRVPTVSARFGTAPFFWNWGMAVMTNLLPREFLRDRSKVQNLVEQFDPVVRAVDGIAGERVSMRVDLECADGRNTLALFSHKRLSVSVGTATAAFALAILEGSTQPGVWFPEEPEGIAIEAREALLKRAAQGTINFASMDGGNKSKRARFRNIFVKILR
ncbi:unnamed protein product [Camellia sinensis]